MPGHETPANGLASEGRAEQSSIAIVGDGSVVGGSLVSLLGDRVHHDLTRCDE